VLRRRATVALAVLVAVAASGCGGPAPSYDVTEPNVFVGAERTCAELDLSTLRCNAVQLRAASELEKLRPGHVPVAKRTLHQKGSAPAGASVPPLTQDVAAIVVFELQDGTRIAVPVLCPRGGTTSDDACNPGLN
jgi:hypothetical protein